MKSRLSRSILSILILSLALQTFTFPALAQSEVNESQAEIENQLVLPEMEQPVYPDDRDEQIYPEGLLKNMPPEMAERDQRLAEPEERSEYIPPSPEIIAETQAQVNAFNCSTVTDVPQIECQALVALYQSTNGAGWWDNSNWLQSTTVSNWYGVTVEDSGVIRLSLWGNMMSGSIPAELGNLTNLQRLVLPYNQLTSIPPQLGNLSNLERLQLKSNRLTSIPTELGNLSDLEDLDLSSNLLTGSIPSTLGNLSNLQFLYLYENQLTGSIPSALGNMSNLQHLYLYENQLTGSIPSALGNMSNLQHLYLYENQLTGSIPSTLSNMSNLQRLYLYENQLTGSIPSALGKMSNLQELLLDRNQLTGNIPAELGNLSNLWSLSLSENQLTGSIPSALGNMSNLQGLGLNENQLTGSIPAELGYLSNLGLLYLSENQLNGSIPMSFVNLSQLGYFYFYETNICEPTTPEFIAWKDTVYDWRGTGIICEENPTDASWLLMYYMAGDNNLDEALRVEITNIVRQKNPNVDIAIFNDSALLDTSYRFFKQGGTVEYQGLGNLNSGDGKTLTDFVNWAKSKSTATNQALIIDDHGHGLTGIASDNRAYYDKLKVNGEIRTALMDAGKVDVIWTFACLMGNIEFMWSLRDLTDYYIGHESVSYASRHDYVSSINQSTTPEDLSKMITESYVRDREPKQKPTSISAVDMSFIQEMFTKTNALAKEIRKSPISTKNNIYAKLDSSVLQRFDESSPLDGIDNSDRLADLFQFASLMLDFDSTKTTAEELLALEDDFVIFSWAWSGAAEDGPFIDHSKARGVSISLPMKPMSFYVGSWMEFGKGADWSFLNGTKTLATLEEEEGYDWGPMISELIFINNPDGVDDPNPPELMQKLIPNDFIINLFLPIIYAK